MGESEEKEGKGVNKRERVGVRRKRGLVEDEKEKEERPLRSPKRCLSLSLAGY